jgi:hypothetical protein
VKRSFHDELHDPLFGDVGIAARKTLAARAVDNDIGNWSGQA